MQSGSLLDRLMNGIKLISENEAVADYKKKSEIYKNVQKAVLQAGVNDELKHDILKLKDLDTFAELLKAVRKFNLENESTAIKFVVKAACTLGGFFNAEANAEYYSIHLHEDILEYAVKNGYLKERTVRNGK